MHPLVARTLTKEEFLVMITGESGDVSTFLQLVDDDLDIDLYHYTITLYDTGLVSTATV